MAPRNICHLDCFPCPSLGGHLPVSGFVPVQSGNNVPKLQALGTRQKTLRFRKSQAGLQYSQKEKETGFLPGAISQVRTGERALGRDR